MFLSMAINFILAALRESIKNPKKKAELRAVMLKVLRTIHATYADDPEFLV